MARLNPKEIKSIQNDLIKMYGKKMVEVDSPKKGVTTLAPVLGSSQVQRIKLLKEVQKSFAFMGATYSAPAGKSGAVKFGGGLEIKAKTEQALAKQKQQGAVPLKPSQIKPKIVDVPMSAAEMAKKVRAHLKVVNNSKLINSDELNAIAKAISNTIKDDKEVIDFSNPNKIMPAEFIEVLSAIKVARQLEMNNKAIKTTLGISPRRNTSRNQIKILIPESANFPLIDYAIIVSGSKNVNEPELRISVKSKIMSPETNTVKISTVFENQLKNVNKWFKSVSTLEKPNELGVKQISSGVLEAEERNEINKTAGAPILAFMNLIKESSQRSKFEKVIQQVYPSMNNEDLQNMKDVVRYLLRKKMNKANMAKSSPLSDSITEKNMLKKALSLLKHLKKSLNTNKTIEPTFHNFSFMCEKVIVMSSRPNTKTKYNFYRAFYDNVLVKQQVAYSVTTGFKGADKEVRKIKFNLYSKQNFKQYKDYIQLRSKNEVNGMTDTFGLSA